MSGSDRPVWFAGDLADPMGSVIAAALAAARTRRIDCPGDLPKPWPAVGDRWPRVVVIHRSVLGGTDAGRLARLRRRLGPDRALILCVGPHVRYADIERWSPWVDLVLPEATAAETIRRQVMTFEGTPVRVPDPGRPAIATGRTVAAVSTNGELRATWAALLHAAGYEVIEARDPELLPAGQAAVWDVPVLEPDWANRLAARTEVGPVVAAIGFLDRVTRTQARTAGAAACLDLPCDLADLMLAVDRATRLRRDHAHPSVPAPMRGPHPSRRTTR